MKKIISCFFITALLCGCSQQEEQQAAAPQKQEIPTVSIDENVVYTFDLNTLKPGCEIDSEIICAVNNSIKCTINPQFSECETNKDLMPKFIFMQDESLQRPTSQSYKITKLKPREDGTVEIYTQSTCNGNWFGLCNGNIIYVMENSDGRWAVKDLYALEN